MRTDSVNLAQEAVSEIRAFIADRYGKGDVPEEPPTFKTKSKNAQEAHEAIRPTSVTKIPAEIKSHLEDDQFKTLRFDLEKNSCMPDDPRDDRHSVCRSKLRRRPVYFEQQVLRSSILVF